jgi:type IV fimbrial biogenesis protein FimT
MATTAAPTVCNSSGTENLVLQKQDALSTSYHFTTTSTGTPYSLTFPASGVGATQATLKLCRFDPSAGSQERQITLTATGRTAVTTTRTGTCA